MTVTSDLAAWALGLRRDSLSDSHVPDEVVAAAGRHLLDGLGTAVAAARRGLAGPALTVAAGLGGPPEATLLGRGVRVSAPAAALATGTLVHALDFDDTHAGGLVHATAVVLPAVLAVGEEVGATGEEAVLAAVAGFEAVCRIAGAAPHAFHQRGLHATHACGVFAAALVAARLLRLTEAQTVDALGIAGSSAGGLLEFLATGSSTKQLHPGLASHAGILAARLAAAGADGPDSVLEGGRGFYAALADGHADPGPGDRRPGDPVGDDPDHAQALPGLPADARRARRRAPDPARRTAPAVTGPVGHRRGPPRQRRDRLRARQGRAAHGVRRQVLASVEPGRAADRRPGHRRHLRGRLAGPARRSPTWPPGCGSIEVPDPRVAADAGSRVEVVLVNGEVRTGTVERSAAASLTTKLTGNVGGAEPAAALAAAVDGLATAPDLTALITLADRLARPEDPA